MAQYSTSQDQKYDSPPCHSIPKTIVNVKLCVKGTMNAIGVTVYSHCYMNWPHAARACTGLMRHVHVLA